MAKAGVSKKPNPWTASNAVVAAVEVVNDRSVIPIKVSTHMFDFRNASDSWASLLAGHDVHLIPFLRFRRSSTRALSLRYRCIQVSAFSQASDGSVDALHIAHTWFVVLLRTV